MTATIDTKARAAHDIDIELLRLAGKRTARFALEEAGTHFVVDGYKGTMYDFIAAESLRSINEFSPRSTEYHAMVRVGGPVASIPYVTTSFAGGNFHSTDSQLAERLREELQRHGRSLNVPTMVQKRVTVKLPREARPELYTGSFPLRDVEWESLEAAIGWTGREEQYLQMVRSPFSYSGSISVSGRSPREVRSNEPVFGSTEKNRRRNYTGTVRWDAHGRASVPESGNTDRSFAEYMRDTVPELSRYRSPVLTFVAPKSLRLPIPIGVPER